MSDQSNVPETVERALQLAQLEHLQLENEVLRSNQRIGRSPKSIPKLVSDWTPVFSAIGAVAAFLWGVHQYQVEQQKNRTQAEAQRASDIEAQKRELAARQREFMKPWLESQRQIYLEALSTAARVISPVSSDDRKQAVEQFWQLYHGKMIVLETERVANEMIHFGECLDRGEACDKKEMIHQLHRLGTAMAESMAATGGMSYEEFASNQFKYQ